MSKAKLIEYLRSLQERDGIESEERARRVESVQREAKLLRQELEAAALEIVQSGIVLNEEKIVQALEAYFSDDENFSDRATFSIVSEIHTVDPIRLKSYGVVIVHNWDEQGLRFKIKVGRIPYLNR